MSMAGRRSAPIQGDDRRWRRATTLFIVIALAALSARRAEANTGIGFLLFSWASAWVLLIVVIPLEGLVARQVLRLSYRGGLRLSARANLISTALGTALSYGLPGLYAGFPGLHPFTLFIPGFFLSVGCEYLVARCAVKPLRKPRVARWAWSANALSYAFLCLLIVAVLRHDYLAARPLVWRTLCVTHLKQLGRLLQSYRESHADRIPRAHDFAAMARQLPGPPAAEILRCPATGKRYVFNTRLSGAAVQTIRNPGETPLVMDAAPHPDGQFCVLLVAGYAQHRRTDIFGTMKKGRFR
jgi:hypothetical protein